MAERQYVIFKVHTEEYGIDIHQVKEIVQMQEITNLPHSNEILEGIINLRGTIIPIIDLNKRFYGMESVINESTRIVVFDEGTQIVGIIVDEVAEVLQISEEMIEPPPPLLTKIKNSGIVGVGKHQERLILFIDFTQTFTRTEIDEINLAVS